MKPFCNKCQTPPNTYQPLLGESKDFQDISSRPALGVSLGGRPIAATNIASDLPEGKESTSEYVSPKISHPYENVSVEERIDAAIGRGDHCQNCDEPLVAAISRATKRCPTCTAIAQNGWVQTQCAQCGNPMVVDIDSFQVICNQCEESNNAN